MRDLVAGKYQLPWESEVVQVDGTSCGFPAPVRPYAPRPPEMAPDDGGASRAKLSGGGPEAPRASTVLASRTA